MLGCVMFGRADQVSPDLLVAPTMMPTAGHSIPEKNLPSSVAYPKADALMVRRAEVSLAFEILSRHCAEKSRAWGCGSILVIRYELKLLAALAFGLWVPNKVGRAEWLVGRVDAGLH